MLLANVTDRQELSNGELVCQPPDKWSTINWLAMNKNVRNLRRRIFKATREGNLKKIRSLQKLMLKSYSNLLLSVRRVTQDNSGKNTPGMDKVTIKTPEARMKFANDLADENNFRANAARRVYIPKKNGKKRPLGIPTIKDRAIQAIVKNALEPYWEAIFEATSYGFRPGRGCHDALQKIFLIARPNKTLKWVVDADIKGCFDNISHEQLLTTIGNFPARRLIKAWLKAGYIDNNVFYSTESGTPQGGIISPLLANIALHGMEKALGVKYNCKGESIGSRMVVRYADDFVIFCKTEEDAYKAKDDINQWLKGKGLELSEEKTKIRHITEGFDFLGINVRQYKVSNTKTGYKLLMKPSKDFMTKTRAKIREAFLVCKGQSVAGLIKKLNPIIRGIANYLKPFVASEAFRSLDDYLFKRQCRYANHTHPTKSVKWKQKRYWGKINLSRNDKWVFGDKQNGGYMLKFSWTGIDRHELVKQTNSPDDPSLREYWGKRQKKQDKSEAEKFNAKKQKVAKNQKYLCPVCGQSIFNGEEIHLHHKKPRAEGGTDDTQNLIWLHLFCHQKVHS